MAVSYQRGTISTTFHHHAAGLRVRFSCPPDGYTLDDLDALSVAIDNARRKLDAPAVTPLVAFATQQARMAAPS